MDRQAAQLMILPARHFTLLRQVAPKVAEVLLVPFYVGDEIVGTLWIIAHDETRLFDSEDHRAVSNLAKFASTDYQRLLSLSASDVVPIARLNKARPLPRQERLRAVQKRVLIIDDNVDAADSLAIMLRDRGHRVHVAYDGRAALELSLSVRPEMVLLDIAMPEMSGYEVAKQIRQHLGDGVRIVAVTGYGQEDDRLRSLEWGIDLHLVKPIDPTFLDSLFKS